MEPDAKVETQEKLQTTPGMGKNWKVFLVVGLLLVLGYKMLKGKPASQTMPASTPVESTPAAVLAPEKTIVLSMQNNSSESGTATLKEVDGKLLVTLDLTGAPANVGQPAHIHSGSCASLGGVKYPLTSPLDGKSETTLSLTMDQLLKDLPLAVNVHKSAAEPTVYVSCGDLTVN